MTVDVFGPGSKPVISTVSNTVVLAAAPSGETLVNAGTTSLVGVPAKIGSALQLKGLLDSASIEWTLVGNDARADLIASATNTLQEAYDVGLNGRIVLDATRGAFTLRDNATPIGTALFDVQDNAPASLFNVSTSLATFAVAQSIISGTAAAPAVRFTSSPTTGHFLAGTDAIGISNAATESWRFESTGNFESQGGSLIRTGFGSESAPGFAFAGDTGTGWFRFGSGVMSFSSSGAQRWQIGSNLNSIGLSRIRTGDGSASNCGYSFAGDVTTGLFLPVAGALGVAADGTEAWRFLATGVLAAQGADRAIQNVLDPIGAQDAATMNYVDTELSTHVSADDHTQYLLLAGRTGGQAAIGGTAAADTLDLQGSTDADRGSIEVFSLISLKDQSFKSTFGKFSIENIDTRATTAAAVSEGVLLSNATTTVNSAVWFTTQINDQGTYIQAVTPGFSAFTLFNAFPTITSGPGGTAATALVGALTVQAAVIHENDGDGAGLTTAANTAVQFRPTVKAVLAGDTMTLSVGDGLVISPEFLAQNATATVTTTIIRGVRCVEPVLLAGHVGTAVLTDYIGLDWQATGGIAASHTVVRSILPASATNFFIDHTGGAQSSHFGTFLFSEFLGHIGDSDTDMRFRANQITFTAGAIEMLDMFNTGQDIFTINGGLNNVDFRLEGFTRLMETDASINGIGFFGATPVAQPAAYTRNAVIVEDRTLLASASATTLNNNNVLAALIVDLQALGLIG